MRVNFKTLQIDLLFGFDVPISAGDLILGSNGVGEFWSSGLWDSFGVVKGK